MVRSVSNDKANDMAAIYSRVSWTIVKPADVRVEEVALGYRSAIVRAFSWSEGQVSTYHTLLLFPIDWNNFRGHVEYELCV